MSQLVDSFGRQHTYLRISVTDRCNLRCHYCMPAGPITWKRKQEILTFEEILRIARVLVELGITKIRITGGEPLVRHELERLIADLARLPGLKTIAMTTNAILLKDKAQLLKTKGLTALNISLDSLRRGRFMEITKCDEWNSVMAAIEEALAVGFNPIKINCVVMADYNDDEIIDFVEFVKDTPMNMRFIEYMPFPDNQWHKGKMLPSAEMKRIIETKYSLIPLEHDAGAVAKDFAVAGHRGTVSFVSSMTDSFCGTCNRLRLTADGSIKSCLFYAPEVNLRDAIRSGVSDDDLRRQIHQALLHKPEAHPPADELAGMANRAMVEIGG